jgi:primosomal protein N' (replication factor Y)
VSDASGNEQLALVREQVRRARPRGTSRSTITEVLPVARVAVDLPLAHLDRPFDYLVPEALADAAKPGVRVRVRFAGQDLDGFVLERVEDSEFGGRLERIRRVVSPEPVLAPEIVQLARAVADHYAGTLADVLRLAIPPRHARVEGEERRAASTASVTSPAPGDWSAYPTGPAFLAALRRGAAPRAVWTALSGADWPGLLAIAAASTAAAGRGALLIVPDARDLARVDGALTSTIGPGHHVALSAELGPAERYRRWLAVRRGDVPIVVGTRAAMFAPVPDVGLVAIWDDGDDSHAEPRAPYPHVREVLCLRAHQSGAAALLAGFARTPEAAQLVQTGWAKELTAARPAIRAAAPRVRALGDDAELARDGAAAHARLPTLAWQAAHTGLATGAPVLVQVPRAGYVPGLACRTCRAPARCAACGGTLGVTSGHAIPACQWCGRPAGGWRCPHCGDSQFRALAVGARRTAEELGRAFPAVLVRTSGGDHILDSVPAAPALIVATPGAEPVADEGYAAALLLDGATMLSRPDLRAGEETFRRWSAAAALVRPASAGGTVVVVADAGLAPVQALIRWDPAGFAARELADRAGIGFPPAARLATLTGAATGVTELLAAADLPASAQVLGPAPLVRGGRGEHAGADGQVRAIVRVPRADGAALSAALHAALGMRSAHKAADPVRVQIDPMDLG